eukprot:2403793-Rhodomonas_salina.2
MAHLRLSPRLITGPSCIPASVPTAVLLQTSCSSLTVAEHPCDPHSEKSTPEGGKAVVWRRRVGRG